MAPPIAWYSGAIRTLLKRVESFETRLSCTNTENEAAKRLSSTLTYRTSFHSARGFLEHSLECNQFCFVVYNSRSLLLLTVATQKQMNLLQMLARNKNDKVKIVRIYSEINKKEVNIIRHQWQVEFKVKYKVCHSCCVQLHTPSLHVRKTKR